MSILCSNSRLALSNNIVRNQGENKVIPTFILIGDSNADGYGLTNPNKYFPQYANEIVDGNKTFVKIFDWKGATNRFITLNKANAQMNNATKTFGMEQTLMWELAQYYNDEIYIIKRGIGSTYAANHSSSSTWQPGYDQMNNFETIYSNALIAAANENKTLDVIAIIIVLGTNDATNSGYANALESNMTTIINHLRNNVIGESVPCIITSATEGTTYHSTAISQQQSLCVNVTDCYYVNIFKYGRTTAHFDNSGYFGAGLEIADSILVNVLSSNTIKSKYAWKYNTNRNGTYALLVRTLENITDYDIDWGDGNTTTVTTNNTTWNHTYADGTTKELSINIFVPWNIITLNLNGAVNSNIVGEFDMSQLTGLDSFTTSGGQTDFTSIKYPITNYNYTVVIAANLIYATGLTSFDYSRFVTNASGTNIRYNTLLTTFTNSAYKSVLTSVILYFSNNTVLTTLDLSSMLTSYIYIRSNTALITYTHSAYIPNAILGEALIDGNTNLQTINNYENLIYHYYIDLRNGDILTTVLDGLINEMWLKNQTVTFLRTTANKRVYLQGNRGVTGTFDSTTDWSGGLPTSPAARAYDLLNDVTGTYNYLNFQLT